MTLNPDSLGKYIANQIRVSIDSIPNPIAEGIRIPLDDSNLSEFHQGNELVAKVQEAAANYSKLPEDLVSLLVDRSIALSLKLFSHDLAGIYVSALLLGKSIEKNPDYAKNPDVVNEFLREILKFKLLGLTGAYLASGGEQSYEQRIPLSQLEFLLDKVSRFQIVAVFGEGFIKSPEYAALYQIVKNARGNAVVSYKEGGKWAKLSIQDNGTGILDEDGNPMPPERLHEIFGEFSTRKNGGLGLQVARRLMELRRGDIEVVSSPIGSLAGEYSTLTGLSQVIDSPRFHGTKFTLYFPRTP